jgi:hypothetical protein
MLLQQNKSLLLQYFPVVTATTITVISTIRVAGGKFGRAPGTVQQTHTSGRSATVTAMLQGIKKKLYRCLFFNRKTKKWNRFIK